MSDNQSLISHYMDLIIRCVEERLNLLMNYEINSSDSAWDLVRKGLVDVVKVFIKNEPHKLSKLEEGRLRLIFSVSLVDNVISRLLSENQNHAEKSVWSAIPCKSGLGLGDDGLIKINQSVLMGALKAELAEVDVQSWDFSFQKYNFDEDLERRRNLNFSHGTVWDRVASAHWHCMSLKVFTLSDGRMFQQLECGIMPSGWYNTAASNTSARAMDSYHVALSSGKTPWGIFMGDDGVETYVENAPYLYSLLGKTVKMYTQVSYKNFEFCSTRFDGHIGYPVNVDKQLNNMFRVLPQTFSDAVARYFQFEHEFRHHPERDEIVALVNSSGWWDDVPPREV